MNLDELARRAGLWRETVLLFAQRGMLPPLDPSGGYGERHLEVVRFIGRMQAEHEVELVALARLLAEHDFEVDRTELAVVAECEPDPSRAGPGPLSRAALAERTGAGAALVDALVGGRLLPEAGPYGGQHVWLAEAARELVAAGLAVDDVLGLGEVAARIAESEVDLLLAEIGRGASPAEALERTRDRRARVGRLVSVSRHAGTSGRLARLAAATDRSREIALVALHVPSPLFASRYQLKEALEDKRQAAEAVLTALEQDDVAVIDGRPVLAYGRLLMGVGRLEETRTLLGRAVARPPVKTDGTAWSYLALARGVLDDDEGAMEAAEQAVKLAPKSPRAHAFRAVVVAMMASGAGDLLRATARLREALASVARSRSLEAVDAVEDLEARLTRGRLCSLLPSALGVRQEGLDDLRYVVSATSPEAPRPTGLEVPGGRELIRLNALFYLGIALEQDGARDEAAPHLEEVLSLDPASGFAREAYRRLRP